MYILRYAKLNWKKMRGRQDGPFISQAGLVGLLLLASPRRSRAASGPPPPETGGNVGKPVRNGREMDATKKIKKAYAYSILIYFALYIYIIVYAYIYTFACI